VQVLETVRDKDVISPSRITNLKSELFIKYRNTIILSWTAARDDLDIGKGESNTRRVVI